MAEVINLRLARKARQRSAAQREAETNRALHGETKAQRKQRAAEVQDGLFIATDNDVVAYIDLIGQ